MLQRNPTFWERVPFMRTVVAGPAPLPPGGRDQRLDMFRGIALLMIFINHVPGTAYEWFTNRNYGFSDAAEAFVFMSGVAAGLAYSSAFLKKMPLWLAVARPWARARQLYFVHLTLTFIFLGTFAGAAHFFGLYELLSTNNLRMLAREPLATLVGIPLLTHQFGYLNILPLYLTLLLATPALILIGLRRPHWLLVGSIVLWFAAGTFRLNFPNYPTSGGWFFNPLSWQLVFVIGLLAGMGMKQGKRFFPTNPVAFLAALGFLILSLLWMKVQPVGALGNGTLRWLWQMGAPFHIHSFDKTFLSLPRLLHSLCLFYVLASIPAMQGVAASKWAGPLRAMGRQGLPVFATGTALSLLFQAVKSANPGNIASDGCLLAFGILVQVALAYALNHTVEMRAALKTKPAA
jgi:hypothetical protein